jgi:hypothetical protein
VVFRVEFRVVRVQHNVSQEHIACVCRIEKGKHEFSRSRRQLASLRSRRWTQNVLPKRRALSELHGVTIQKTVLFSHNRQNLNSINLRYMEKEELAQLSRCTDWLRAGRPRGQRSCPGRVKNFLFSTSSRSALGSTQPPIQCIPGALSPGVKLTTHFQLVLRSRKHGSIHTLPHTPSWRSA